MRSMSSALTTKVRVSGADGRSYGVRHGHSRRTSAPVSQRANHCGARGRSCSDRRIQSVDEGV
jgi:hypothetical protein